MQAQAAPGRAACVGERKQEGRWLVGLSSCVQTRLVDAACHETALRWSQAGRVEWLGVGVQLPLRSLEAAPLARALRAALAEPVLARCRDLADALAAERGTRVAAAAVREAVSGAAAARQGLLRALAAARCAPPPQVPAGLCTC